MSDNSNLVFLDLCSGLGGASQPALDRGWTVIRVDIDARFRPTIVADVGALPLRPFHVDVLWASPPCTEFTKSGMPASWLTSGKGWSRAPTCETLAFATSLVMACLAAVDTLRPAFWVIENVMASRKYLTPILGMVRAKTCGHVFWGKLPGLIPPTRAHKWKLPPTPDRSALRAKIPYEIGEAICRAVEQRSENGDCSHGNAPVSRREGSR